MNSFNRRYRFRLVECRCRFVAVKRLKLLRLSTWAWCWLLFVQSSAARDLFVDNRLGDDRQTGLRERPAADGGPVSSIARALQLVLPGDRIVLTNTGLPYRESISLSAGRHSGALGSPLIIDGRDSTLAGMRPVPADVWEHVSDDLYRFRAPRLSSQQLFLNNDPLPRRPLAGAEPQNVDWLAHEWCLHAGWTYFNTRPGKIPSQEPVAYAALPVGITLYQVQRVEIHNLTVTGFALDGISAHDRVQQCRLVNVRCRGNGRAGVTIAGSSQVELTNCQSQSNGVAQLWVEGESLAVVQDCKLADDAAPSIEHRGGRLIVDGQLVRREP